MSANLHTLILDGITLPLEFLEGDVYFMARKRLSQAGLSAEDAKLQIYRRSIDARRKSDIRLVWSVSATLPLSTGQLARLKAGKIPHATLLKREEIPTPTGTTPLPHPPVVVGSGPAGLFAALYLARHGYRPILLERGGNVEERRAAMDTLTQRRVLDPETNVQFGAGGAGTFSDGKLVTRVNHPLTAAVMDTFVAFGAPEEIRIQAKPHIGTDILATVVGRMLDEIATLGGQVCYHTRLTRILRHGEQVVGVETNQGVIATGAVILATGHSARDTYMHLIEEGYALEAKPFSVGVRVEHLQADIDAAMYGAYAGHPALGPAEYHLSHNTSQRGVYSFCMCPGGYVMAATSEEEGVVVNGMSYHKRDGKNANSAIAVSVLPSDFGGTPIAAMEFQRKIEKMAFVAGGSDYSAPVTLMGDFLEGKKATTLPAKIQPTYMDGQGYRLSSPDAYLPPFVTEALRGAFPAFEKKIEGFSHPQAVLSGAETRTSAPIRILRHPETRTAIGTNNLYPAGEGAGYAGGITSAALDGLGAAIALASVWAPGSSNH